MKTAKFKNWVLPILGIILTIADLGFEAINPILLELGIPDRYIGILKAVFGIYGLYRIATNKPIIQKDVSADDGIGGSNPPPKKDEK